MTLTGPQKIPFANTTRAWYGDKYPGSAMESNVGVVHTTEGTTLPDYNGGASAPNVTAVPDFKNKKLVWYQHFDVDRSSRALVNKSGGVETNTLNAFQIELVGTCDPAKRVSWGSKKAGVDYIFWPEAPDWALKGLGELVHWLAVNHKIPAKSSVVWKAYPASYGNSAVRLTGARWASYYGWLGHQHVPENCVHPDTLILTGDSRWVRAGDLRTGDRLVGFDEDNAQVGSTPGRRFRESFATVHGVVEKDCYRVVLEDGTQVTASADHKWLVNLPYVSRGSRIAWVQTKDLDPAKHRVKCLGVQPWSGRDDKIAGYLAGSIDCDGAVVFNQSGDSSVLFGQAHDNADVLDRFLSGVREAKLDLYEKSRSDRPGFGKQDFTDIRVKGGLWRIVSFLAQVGPEKFERVRDNCWVNRVVGKTTTSLGVVSVAPIGLQPVVSLETSTRTYVANGMLCHNTHGDPGNIDFARVLAHANGTATTPTPIPPKETEVALSTDDVKKILGTDGIIPSPDGPDSGNTHWAWASYVREQYLRTRETLLLVDKLTAQVAALEAKLDAVAAPKAATARVARRAAE